MDRELKKGILDICVLKYLLENDSYGYKIITDLGKLITLSESTLYPILRRLELNKSLETYTEEHNGRLRKYYKITNIGKTKIEDFKTEWKEIKKVYDFIVGSDKK